jgi:hypothetical protein
MRNSKFLIAARDMVEAVTGQRPIGYNCNWLRRGPNTWRCGESSATSVTSIMSAGTSRLSSW